VSRSPAATSSAGSSNLLQVELADRDVRRQQRLLRLARFPRPKRLEEFDFTKNPNVIPEVVADLKSPARGP